MFDSRVFQVFDFGLEAFDLCLRSSCLAFRGCTNADGLTLGLLDDGERLMFSFRQIGGLHARRSKNSIGFVAKRIRLESDLVRPRFRTGDHLRRAAGLVLGLFDELGDLTLTLVYKGTSGRRVGENLFGVSFDLYELLRRNTFCVGDDLRRLLFCVLQNLELLFVLLTDGGRLFPHLRYVVAGGGRHGLDRVAGLGEEFFGLGPEKHGLLFRGSTGDLSIRLDRLGGFLGTGEHRRRRLVGLSAEPLTLFRRLLQPSLDLFLRTRADRVGLSVGFTADTLGLLVRGDDGFFGLSRDLVDRRDPLFRSNLRGSEDGVLLGGCLPRHLGVGEEFEGALLLHLGLGVASLDSAVGAIEGVRRFRFSTSDRGLDVFLGFGTDILRIFPDGLACRQGVSTHLLGLIPDLYCFVTCCRTYRFSFLVESPRIGHDLLCLCLGGKALAFRVVEYRLCITLGLLDDRRGLPVGTGLESLGFPADRRRLILDPRCLDSQLVDARLSFSNGSAATTSESR